MMLNITMPFLHKGLQNLKNKMYEQEEEEGEVVFLLLDKREPGDLFALIVPALIILLFPFSCN